MNPPLSEPVPGGCTSPGVNREIIEHLLARGDGLAGKALLDIPCGTGELILALRRFFPKAEIKGCDLTPPAGLAPGDFEPADAARSFPVFDGRQFDCILCVSGVMEFDNTLAFFESCHARLRGNGELIVTNDNLSAVRDRALLLLLGKTHRFPLYTLPGDPTWKAIPIQNLVRLLLEAGFEIRKIRHVLSGWRDWCWLPLAALLYPILALHRRVNRGSMPQALRRAMFPFRSLLSRHYVIYCARAK